MTHRSQRSAPERHARSQLAQLLTEQPFLRGSLIDRARSCGKPTCRCQKGQVHHSLYLAVNHRGQRVLLYVPRALHETVRRRERVAGQWQQTEETSSWYWATTLSQRQLCT